MMTFPIYIYIWKNNKCSKPPTRWAYSWIQPRYDMIWHIRVWPVHELCSHMASWSQKIHSPHHIFGCHVFKQNHIIYLSNKANMFPIWVYERFIKAGPTEVQPGISTWNGAWPGTCWDPCWVQLNNWGLKLRQQVHSGQIIDDKWI